MRARRRNEPTQIRKHQHKPAAKLARLSSARKSRRRSTEHGDMYIWDCETVRIHRSASPPPPVATRGRSEDPAVQSRADRLKQAPPQSPAAEQNAFSARSREPESPRRIQINRIGSPVFRKTASERGGGGPFAKSAVFAAVTRVAHSLARSGRRLAMRAPSCRAAPSGPRSPALGVCVSRAQKGKLLRLERTDRPATIDV